MRKAASIINGKRQPVPCDARIREHAEAVDTAPSFRKNAKHDRYKLNAHDPPGTRQCHKGVAQ